MIYTKEDDVFTFNVSKGKTNSVQRDNLYQWTHPKNNKLVVNSLTECNVTAMVTALNYAGWVLPKEPFKDPEDNLCKFIFESQKILDEYKRTMPVLYKQFEDGDDNAYTPNEVHAILAYGVNHWLQVTNAVQFSEHRKIEDIFNQIITFNLPVVMSGTFPYKNKQGKDTTMGHIDTLVGLKYRIKGISRPTEHDFIKTLPFAVIIDDPYGNVYENFSATSNGNDVEMPYADFIKWYKPVKDETYKMGHIISSPVAVAR